MQGIKVFVSDLKTRKKGYKMLAMVVENFELSGGIEELKQINNEVTPLVDSQATKQRLGLVKAYIQ